jgi:hypothetical protein
MITVVRTRAVVAAVVLSVALAGCIGDPAPTAVVDGRSYAVTVVRGLVVAETDLEPWARIERADDASGFADDQAYALSGVDPLTFLVVRAKPGLKDDAGPWGDFIGLMGGGHDSKVCGYFVRLAPTLCE